MPHTIILLVASIFALLVALVVSSLAWFGILAAPYVPSRKKDLKRIFELGKVKKGDLVYDLGSGDGRILIYGVKHYGTKGVGIELAAFPYLWSKTKILLKGLRGQVQIRWGSFFRTDLSEADVVVTYLLPKAMQKLRPKFERELKKGAKVIALGFEIDDWQHIIYDKPNKKHVGIYVYNVDK